VSLPSIKRLELIPGPLRAQPRTIEAIGRAFEDAGVEFTNGGQPGVRMKGRTKTMTYEQFLNSLRLFDGYRLRTMGVQTPEPLPAFGFGLVYDVGRAFADLMFQGRWLGRISWRAGAVTFDPPLPRGQSETPFDEDLVEWASRAHARSVTTA
jgi:hypothetical protein